VLWSPVGAPAGVPGPRRNADDCDAGWFAPVATRRRPMLGPFSGPHRGLAISSRGDDPPEPPMGPRPDRRLVAALVRGFPGPVAACVRAVRTRLSGGCLYVQAALCEVGGHPEIPGILPAWPQHRALKPAAQVAVERVTRQPQAACGRVGRRAAQGTQNRPRAPGSRAGRAVGYLARSSARGQITHRTTSSPTTNPPGPSQNPIRSHGPAIARYTLPSRSRPILDCSFTNSWHSF